MKKWLCLLLACLLPIAALAESLTLRVVGMTSDGSLIHELTTENGQRIYFTALEPSPEVWMEDVNFDGANDIVACVGAGASNMFFEFFVYEDGVYVQASHDGTGDGLCNYQLYPELNMVLTQANNGHAGALHEWRLFRWEGTSLQLIRSAVSQNRQEYDMTENAFVTTEYLSEYEITVRDHGGWEGEIIWQATVSESDMIDGWVFEQESAALWQGIKK